VDRRVVGVRALAFAAAIVIIGGAVGSGQVAYGGTASAAAAATRSASEVASAGAAGLTAPRDTTIVETTAAGPAGWSSITSPWLGYGIALPSSWGFLGHVTAAESRTPHDVFAGIADGAETPMTLVVGTCTSADATVAGPDAGVIAADGGTFDVTAPQVAEAGRMTIVATSVAGDTTWYLTACMADDSASLALFRTMVASFRFPDADFVPPAEASPAP
jgi:hypothetical protein